MLGGSPQQVPAIKAAKEMGYRVVLCDYLPDNPGQAYADKWYEASTTDIGSVTKIAMQENASGILAYASDPAALPAAIVCETLGLACNPVKSVEILGVKHKFREFLQNNGFPCPKSATFSPDDNDTDIIDKCKNFNFPIIVKPTDSSGSKGVTLIVTTNELPNKLQEAKRNAGQYSRNKILIVEEYIQRGFPYVVGGDIFVENGIITLWGEMACLRDPDGNQGLIPVGKKLPCGLSNIQRKNLHSALQKLIDRLEIKNGEFNIELIIDKNDQPHFLEVGPRAGGNMIPIQLSDAYGVDLIGANISAAMGDTVSLKPKSPSGCYLTHVLHSNRDGVFQKIEYSDEITPYIYRECIYKRKGDTIEKFDGAGKAIGIIFLRLPDEEILAKIETKIKNLITIHID